MRGKSPAATIVAMPDTGIRSMELWSSAAFVEEARDWVAREAAAHGLSLTGECEQPHLRPWSSAFRFETSGGRVWFKVNGAGTRHEPTLTRALAGLVPGLVPEVLAVDATRGWSLSRDAGPVMRSVAAPDGLWSAWEVLVARYADAQIDLAAHVPDLCATGVREASPATLPAQAAEILKALEALPVAEGGLTRAQADEVARRLPVYAAWCERLGASGIPSSVQHDDLHSANVCWGGSASTARIIDWGDASLGHPLGTMLCTLNSVAHHAGVEIDHPRVQRVRDAYLEPFTGFASRTELVEYVGLARRVGCVTRAMTYIAALQGEPVATHDDLGFPVRGWLLEMLEP